MKKLIVLLFLFITVFGLLIPVNAVNEPAENETMLCEEISGVLTGKLCEEDEALLRSTDLYRLSGIKEFSYRNQPVLKEYISSFWDIAHLPLEEMIEEFLSFPLVSQYYLSDHYIVFDPEPIRVRKTDPGTGPVLQIFPEKNMESHLSDLINLESATLVHEGKMCRVTEICCFNEGFTRSKAVYFKTDQGIFVRVYHAWSTEGIWFTEERFQVYAAEYYQFCRDHAYDENGQPLYGNQSFRSDNSNGDDITLFVPNMLSDDSKIDVIAPTPANEASVEKTESSELFSWIVWGVSTSLILVCGAIVLHRYRRQNKGTR